MATVHTYIAKNSLAFKPNPWVQIQGFVSLFEKSVIEMAREDTKGLATWMRDEVKSRVYNQTFDHAPLSKRYLAWKKKKGLDQRVLIATNDYIRLIDVVPTASSVKTKETTTWAVGPPEGIHQPSGLRYKDLARILEFGSKKANVPPRPHWRPVWSIAIRRGEGILKNVKNKSLRIVRKWARSKGRKV